MTYFAELNEEGRVLRVIVASAEYIQHMPGHWIETYFDGEARKNYASIDYLFDQVRDAFIPPKPYPSWLLVEQTCKWVAPVPYPPGVLAIWNEALQTWTVVPGPVGVAGAQFV